MEVQFSQELEAKLNRVAAENHSAAQDYVKQLAERYFDHDAWLRERVRKSLKRLDAGEFSHA
jgi:hypothetical protein